jgi:putative Mg2+ transporter-C (MgtC) family protein
MDEVRLLPRLLAAFVLGLVLGLERERRGKPAGLRTHTIVCISTATLMALADLLQTRDGSIVGDPTRMAQGILTGIGFIGAGTIVRQRNMVIGVTTAATIWLTATVGMLAGAGFYVLGVALTLLSVAALDGLEWLVRRVRPPGPSWDVRQTSDAEAEFGEND